MVSHSVAASNTYDGIVSNSNGSTRASDNAVTRNGCGFDQTGTGVFESRGNSTVRGNTLETCGTITPFTGL